MQITSVFDEASATVVLPSLSNPDLDETQTVDPVPAAVNRDPYTVSEDGHFVGHDGFRVPRDFAEFYATYPRFVRGFVRRKWGRASDADLEDRESELVLHLMTLPVNSKFRAAGYNGFAEGCADRIQAFNPERVGGASSARFFNYINLCLMNHFCSLARRASANPIRRVNTLSLYGLDPDGEMVDEDYLFKLGSSVFGTAMSFNQAMEQYAYIDEYLLFIREHNPELVPVLDAISIAHTFIEAQRQLGMTENLFLRARNRLIVLFDNFNAGMRPPTQRKVYSPRVRKVGTTLKRAPVTRIPAALARLAETEMAEA